MPSEVSIDGPERGRVYRGLIYEWKRAMMENNSDVLVCVRGQEQGTFRPQNKSFCYMWRIKTRGTPYGTKYVELFVLV